mmetsp:Transcript_24989/g.47883  ORF Transcript_24989/g.47883 Transcript_24989/m.47883 type:complete len:107 (-) Transcript_24989:74-394(-)
MVGVVGTFNRCLLVLFWHLSSSSSSSSHGVLHSEEGGSFFTGGQFKDARLRRQNAAIEAKSSTIVVCFNVVCFNVTFSATASIASPVTVSISTISVVEQLNCDAEA